MKKERGYLLRTCSRCGKKTKHQGNLPPLRCESCGFISYHLEWIAPKISMEVNNATN